MDKTEIIVWSVYAGIVILGLVIFISISCYVRTKLHICEEEQAMIRNYNKQIAKGQQYNKEQKNDAKTPPKTKETFSLFNLLS